MFDLYSTIGEKIMEETSFFYNYLIFLDKFALAIIGILFRIGHLKLLILEFIVKASVTEK